MTTTEQLATGRETDDHQRPKHVNSNGFEIELGPRPANIFIRHCYQSVSLEGLPCDGQGKPEAQPLGAAPGQAHGVHLPPGRHVSGQGLRQAQAAPRQGTHPQGRQAVIVAKQAPELNVGGPRYQDPEFLRSRLEHHRRRIETGSPYIEDHERTILWLEKKLARALSDRPARLRIRKPLIHKGRKP